MSKSFLSQKKLATQKPGRNGIFHPIGYCGGYSFFFPSNQDVVVSLEVNFSWGHNMATSWHSEAYIH